MTNTQYKKDFIRKHGKRDWQVKTSPMNEYGEYVKTYTFADGAQLIEVNGPYFEDVEFEVKGVRFTQTVKPFRTECWNSDDPTSKYRYEKF